ncbi:hypothetical protein JAAARDRAFT_694455 [Jaapia argillacea MUCL 33604]|uniref:Uncharacterized protein n=1 Tax=Jaapia argillacea MUCL 33604 TaxID=933084 RepID=A0A067QAK4_9AGAM|nr:hypothetical protein JAAARDRAFT_694455 [Jaapia argillacea MUCL 33604]
MWIAHFASGLIAKPFAPGVPLSLLCLAGCLPDVVFFTLNFLGVESFRVDNSIAKKGGAILAATYTLTTDRKVTLRDQLAIIIASTSHFLLEWPTHRADVKITPSSTTAFGTGIFDFPFATFITETLIFLLGLWFYTSFSPLATRGGYKRNQNWLWAVLGVFVLQQAHFSFGSAPTNEARWVHAPAFLGEIVASAWLIGKLEG